MKSFTRYLVLLSVVALDGAPSPELPEYLYSFTEPFRILPTSPATLYATRGIMNGFRQCGGQGQVTQWRHEACDASIPGPCAIPVGQFFRAEMRFIPKNSTNSMGVYTIMLDPLQNYAQMASYKNSSVQESTVEAGTEYALSTVVDHTTELKGRLVATRLIVYREVDEEIEVCAEVDYYLV